jgi:protein-S-isoprenylcysteine O-methyltransferase Ste14
MTTLALCLLCTAANAFFYLDDPNYFLLKGESRWPPILAVALLYALFGLLAWQQRSSTPSSLITLILCFLSAGLLVWGRGQDWHSSVTIPNYYNQAFRFGTIFGGIGQIVCLSIASLSALLLSLLQRFSGTQG